MIQIFTKTLKIYDMSGLRKEILVEQLNLESSVTSKNIVKDECFDISVI
jgi:hypothetical protein